MTLSTWIPYTLAVSAVLAVAAWLLERALRRHDAPIRGVYATALAGSMLLPLLALVVPGSSPAALGQAVRPTPIDPTPGPLPDLTAAPVLPIGWDPLLAAGWIVLSLVMGSLVLLSAIRLARTRAAWMPTSVDGRKVLLSDGLGPAVVGFLRTAIVIPRWALGMRQTDRELMLRHEEEHRRAGDPQLLLAGLLLLVLLPWNPALWWLLGRLRLAVEIDCDRRVLRGDADLGRYARLLVEIGRRGATPRGLGAVAFARPAPFLERRIRAMIDRPTPRPLRTAGLAGLACLLAVGACRMDRPGPVEPPPEDVLDAPQAVADRADTDRPGPIAHGSYVLDVRTGPGTLTGIVTHDGTPVPGAQVVLPEAELGAMTNRQGRFLLLNVPVGVHPLRVTHTAHPDDWEGRVHVRTGPTGTDDGPETSRSRPDPSGTSDADRDGRPISAAIAVPTASGTGVLAGTVVDQAGTALEGAQLILEELGMGAVSNSHGRFLLLNVPAGTRRLTLVHPAHGRWTVEIEVTEGRTADAGELRPPRR